MIAEVAIDKKKKVPNELAELFDESFALQTLRDIYAKLPFGFRKARKLAIESTKKQAKFWREVIQLYPELLGKDLIYRSGYVWESEKIKEND